MSIVSVARPARDCAPRLADIDAVRASYHVEVPERFNAVLDIVEAWASEDPDALAVLSVDGVGDVVAQHSAADLARASREVARALLDLGVGKGDHVFVMLPRIPEWYAALLGAIRIGAIPMPGPNLLTAKDIAYRFDQTGATAAITDQAGAEKVDAAVPGLGDAPVRRKRARAAGCRSRSAAGRLATGRRRSTRPVATTQCCCTSRVARSPTRRWSSTASPTRSAISEPRASGKTCAPAICTGRSPTPAGPRRRGAVCSGRCTSAPRSSTWRSASPRPTRSSASSPAIASRRSAPRQRFTGGWSTADFSKYDLSALRHCTSAGEPLNPEVIREWRRGTGGLTVYDGYGQTETTCLVANYRTMEVRPGSMGRPVPGYDVAIVDDDGQPVESGSVGNIVVRCEPERPIGLFPGYHNDPVASAGRFRGPFYFTGDRAAMDADGYFWFEGREDDVITSSAYRIGPFEVESVLVEHPAVIEAAVVGKPDPERTEIVTAFCILAAGHTGSPELAHELQEFVKSSTAPYKYPREIHFVEELPKTISGKIRRSELRARLRADSPD